MSLNTHIDAVLEWRCLGFLTDDKFADYIYRLTENLFTFERKAVFTAIRNAHMVYGSVTPEGIEQFLGKVSPTQLDVPVGTSIEPIIDRLVIIATRRQLKEKATRLEAISNNDVLDLTGLHSELEFKPILQTEDAEVSTGSQVLLSNYKRKKDGTYQYISTGFDTLDSYMRGEWQIGLTVLGGLSGTGKTAFSLHSMYEMARRGISSVMINLEMEKDALVERLAANIAGVNALDIAVAGLTDSEETRFENAVNEVNGLPIKMICNSDLNVTDIIGYIKDWAGKGYKVFFIDHLQLIKVSNDNWDKAFGEVAWALKMIANKLKVRIILLTQLTEKNGGFEVRYSGEVRPKAETFIVLHTDAVTDRRIIHVKFEKNRGGRLGEFPLIFEAPFQRFIDQQARQYNQAAD